MLLLALDHATTTPAYRQICDRIVRLVDDGTLEAGSRLPPSRALAGSLGVNRSTVVRAYQELWALGILESRPGSYSTIRRRGRQLASPSPAEGLIDWNEISGDGAHAAFEALASLPAERGGAADVISFARLTADPALCPAADLRRCIRQALLDGGGALLDYGDPAGYAPLREVIARRMRTHGVGVTPAEILLTAGAQHGLDLVLRLLVTPGAPVVVESPTYAMALPLLAMHGAALRPVAMRPDGLDLDQLEALLGRERPALVYTVPTFHNPTGVTTSPQHRERLLALCERHRVPLIEDGFEEEMKYFGRAVLPLKSMDARGVVVYLGTFSKVVFPGLRVGWIAAERECVRRLLALARFSSLSGNSLAQAAVARFCSGGHYEEHLRRVHAATRRRMLLLLRTLREELPPRGVEWTQPSGGYTLWLELDTQMDEEAVLAELAKERVRLSPGRFFFPSPHPRPCLRLSIAGLDEASIAEGCRRLGRALARVVEAR